MSPTTYHLPAALVLLAGGLLACFAGYRLFRFVLGVYGFILGALAAVSLFSPTTTIATAIAILIGGAVGAVLLTFAYFLGVMLIGGGAGVLLVQTIWAQQGWGVPNLVPLFVCAVLGAALALIFQRYVIILGTGFGGAWTAVMGLAAMSSGAAAAQISDPANLWIVRPFSPPLATPWVTGAWLLLGIAGVVVQFRAGRHAHRKP